MKYTATHFALSTTAVSERRRRYAGAVVAVVVAMVALYGFATMSETARAHNSTIQNVPHVLVPGNVQASACAVFGFSTETAPPVGETTTYPLGASGFTVDVTSDGTFVSFESELLINQVYIKGGNDAHLYDYVANGYPNGVLNDAGLHAPLNPSGSPAGVSHVVFCWDDTAPPETILTVTKTADATYDRVCEWDVLKEADETNHSVEADGVSTVDVEYTVTFSVECVEENFIVSGTITVENTGALNATVNSVTDDVDGVAATVLCEVTFPHVLAPGESFDCTYEAELADATDGENVATANADNQAGTDTIDFDSEPVPFTFVQNPTIDGCVDIADTWPEAAGVGLDGTLCEEDAPFDPFVYTVTFGPFTGEHCGRNEYTNTASFVTDTTATTGDSSVTVVITVDCGEWCSPGYWRNHLDEAAVAAAAGGFSLDDKYSAHFGAAPPVSKKAIKDGASADPTLQEVLEHPEWYGGEAFNNVGDLLSDAHPDVDFGGIRVEDSCPLN